MKTTMGLSAVLVGTSLAGDTAGPYGCASSSPMPALEIASSVALADGSQTLAIDADGFASGEGHAYARLYRPGDNVTGTPWRQVRADIIDKRARFEVPDLAFGDYALVVHHDVNDNGKIDHSVIGLPSEPLGFSNGFTLSVLSGKPTFEKLRFTFGPGSASVRITVR